MLLGMEEQELLDRLPEIADSIIEAFQPIMNALAEAGERVIGAFGDWYAGLPPEARADLDRMMAEQKDESDQAAVPEKGMVVSINDELRWIPDEAFKFENEAMRDYLLINKAKGR